MMHFILLIILLLLPGCSDSARDVPEDSTDVMLDVDTLPVIDTSGPIDTLPDVDTIDTASTKPRKDTVTVPRRPDTTSKPVVDKPITTPPGVCDEPTAERITQGKIIFAGKGNCVNCHKGDGSGSALGPDLTDNVWIHISGDYPSIAHNVRTGVDLPKEHPTPMPARGGGNLSDEEICAVAAYVWSVGKRK